MSWPTFALSQPEDATTRAAYDVALKCFVANGVARGNAKDRGDTANATAFEKKSRESFDTAMKLGDELGYVGGRVNQDFGMIQAAELPKFVKSKNYLFVTLLNCQGAGL
jgi:hypothetical protein